MRITVQPLNHLGHPMGFPKLFEFGLWAHYHPNVPLTLLADIYEQVKEGRAYHLEQRDGWLKVMPV